MAAPVHWRRHLPRWLLAALGIACATVLALPAISSAATLSVNDDATASDAAPPGANCGTADHATISDAVADPAAVAGSTILVCEGSYPEAVTVDKRLSIIGARGGVDARTRTGPESVVGDSDGGFIVNGGVNDVTIDGFTITGATGGPGIYTPPTGRGQAILNNKINGNVFGLYLNNRDGGQTVVRHNFFADNNEPGAAEGSGIYADQGTDDVLIDANRFTDHANTGILFTATAPTTNDNVVITNNQLLNGNPNPAFNLNRILLVYTRDATVGRNTITDVDATGIQLLGENVDVDVLANTVSGTGGFPGVRVRDCPADVCGVDIGPNDRVVVNGNSFTRTSTAIEIAENGYEGFLTARFNRIAGNAVGLRLDDTGEMVVATDNWWGCNAGPANGDCDPIAGAGASGVFFNPWLVLNVFSSPTTIPTGANSAVTASLTQNSAGQTPGGNLFPAGVPVGFAANFGTITSPVATSSPFAPAVFTAGPNPGTANYFATLDNQTVGGQLTITGGAATVAQQASGRCANRKVGGGGADDLAGGGDGDRLKGKGGDDRLRGRGGDDCLNGGTENDRLRGGGGEDLLKGGAGDDAINAKDGEFDRVRCGFGEDRAVVDAIDAVKVCEVVN